MITAAAFVLSVRLDSRYIALLGLLGGFLNPYLVSSGQDRPNRSLWLSGGSGHGLDLHCVAQEVAILGTPVSTRYNCAATGMDQSLLST